MSRSHSLLCALCLSAAALLSTGRAQAQAPDAAALETAQRTAMQALSFLDGQWRGQARYTAPDGSTHASTHTERVGTLLDGAIRLVEGRSHDGAGKSPFNAFAVISFDPASGAYSMRSHAMGRAQDFPLQVRADGFAWKISAGPATIDYVATVKDGRWHETGTRTMPGQPPVRFFEMTLERIGDSQWPAAGAVPSR